METTTLQKPERVCRSSLLKKEVEGVLLQTCVQENRLARSTPEYASQSSFQWKFCEMEVSPYYVVETMFEKFLSLRVEGEYDEILSRTFVN